MHMYFEYDYSPLLFTLLLLYLLLNRLRLAIPHRSEFPGQADPKLTHIPARVSGAKHVIAIQASFAEPLLR